MNTKKGTTGYFSDSRAFFKFINNKKKSDGFIYVAFFFLFLKVLLTIKVLFHEKGDKNDISNYRPLAEFTNTKIFQSLIQISLNNVCKYVLSRNQQRI